jgi:CHAT domain-containing protein/Flp pilus assembly protein TadD
MKYPKNDQNKSFLSCILAFCLLSSCALPLVVMTEAIAQPALETTTQPKLSAEGVLDKRSKLRETGERFNLYTFKGKVGEKLSVELSSHEFTPFVNIFGLNLKPLDKEIEYQSYTEIKTRHFSVVILFTLPESGEYTIGVTSIQPNEMGHYQIQVRPASSIDVALAEAGQLNQQVLQMLQKGKYQEGISVAERALKIRKHYLVAHHPEIADSLHNLAALYERQGQYKEAEAFALQSLEIFRSIYGDSHPSVATSLNNLATLYENQGRYKEAESLNLQILRLRESLLGGRHPYVATSLNNLAGLYQKQGRYEEAETLYTKVLGLRKLLLGDRHSDVAASLSNLALIYHRQGHYEKAQPLYLQALELYKSYGDRHPDVTTSLNNLAELYRNQGQYEKAEPLLLQALELRKSLLGDRHPDVTVSLNNLALLYYSQGRYEKAEPLYLEVLELRKSLLGNRHPYVASSLNNLAELYHNQGHFDKAELLFFQALELNKSIHGNRHPDVATNLNNLAGLYETQGQYGKAKTIYTEVLELRKSLLGDRHPDVAISLNNLAFIYYQLGQYDKVEPLYIQALELNKSIYGNRHPDVATNLNNLAGLYEIQGDYEKAEHLLSQALELNKTIYGDQHPHIASTLNNLALINQSLGRYDKAERLLSQALELNKTIYGAQHPEIAINFNNLAFTYLEQGFYGKAIKSLEQGLAVEETNLAINLEVGAEGQKRDYFAKIKNHTDATVSLHLQHNTNNPQVAKLAFTTILRRKGRILNTLTDSLQRLRQNLTPDDQAILNQLITINTQIANLNHNLTQQSPNEYRTKIANLEQEATRYSADLSRRSAAFRSAIQPVTLTTIQSALPSDSILLELVKYHPFNPKTKYNDRFGSPRYAAYILNSSSLPKGIDLGPAQAIDEALATLRNDLRDKDTPIPQLKQSARALDKLLMQPIRQYLGATRNLLLSPDSSLNLLPFETLVDEQGRYLLETYNITYLTSGSDLLRLQNPKPNNNAALILADPYFGKPATPISQPTRNVDLTKQSFPPLNGTRDEAIAIAPLFNMQSLLGSDATETAIKQTKSPKILHIATHGFFLPTPEATNINPLLNSGLVFAGVQVGKSGSDDGILTALEVSNLNLSATKLVTLSACDTGLGTISNGEGIYGLRRALTIAGAESQVISLWKVADDATKGFMINYYIRLNKDEGRSAALHQAQRDMLKSEKYSHPYYWAAFIPSGDWRPITNKAQEN